jgi:hydrogenase expression/formation protein HypD
MKFLEEYRNAELVKELAERIKANVSQEWSIMEICGGQTHSLVKNGLIDILPDEINLIHGPGCPVCVTPVGLIDSAVDLAMQSNVVLCSFGDMLRVPGTEKSLSEAKTNGADVRIVYSPLDALKIASLNPEK